MVFEAMTDGFVTVDESGSIRNINPAALEMFGYERPQAIRESVALLIPAFTPKDLTGGIGDVHREVVGLRATGEEFPLDIIVGEGRSRSGDRFFVCVIQDISTRKAAEQDLRTRAEELAAANSVIEASRVDALLIAEEAPIAVKLLGAVEAR